MPKGISATYCGSARSAAARKGAATRARAKAARAAAAIGDAIGAVAPADYVPMRPGELRDTIERALARIATAKAREAAP